MTTFTHAAPAVKSSPTVLFDSADLSPVYPDTFGRGLVPPEPLTAAKRKVLRDSFNFMFRVGGSHTAGPVEPSAWDRQWWAAEAEAIERARLAREEEDRLRAVSFEAWVELQESAIESGRYSDHDMAAVGAVG
jgi:hypothetical protein